jgi:uncharacterized protein (TIGR02588 family)
MATTKAKRSDQRKEGHTPILEWVLGGIGCVLLVSCVVFLVYEGLSSDEQPGPITATVLEIVDVGNRHVVTFEVMNGGSQTLSNFQVSGRLLERDREVERATTTIDYLPGRSSQQGGFYFDRDPRDMRLEIVPEGYQKP